LRRQPLVGDTQLRQCLLDDDGEARGRMARRDHGRRHPSGQLLHGDRGVERRQPAVGEVRGRIRGVQLERHAANLSRARMLVMGDLLLAEDGLARCSWCGDDPLYTSYHDREWGRPLTGDDAVFELLTLEGFQAGLAWITILRKREGFRNAFARFEIERVARFAEPDVERLLGDAGIVGTAARSSGDQERPGGARAARRLSELVWSFAPPRARRPRSLADPGRDARSRRPCRRS
jgi:DNA-3-methyladenine glycosylase I